MAVEVVYATALNHTITCLFRTEEKSCSWLDLHKEKCHGGQQRARGATHRQKGLERGQQGRRRDLSCLWLLSYHQQHLNQKDDWPREDRPDKAARLTVTSLNTNTQRVQSFGLKLVVTQSWSAVTQKGISRPVKHTAGVSLSQFFTSPNTNLFHWPPKARRWMESEEEKWEDKLDSEGSWLQATVSCGSAFWSCFSFRRDLM